MAGRSVQSYEKRSFFSVFSPLGPFLKLYEMIRMSRLVACPIVFILLCDQNGPGGVFKVMKKDHFLVFLTVWVLFPKFFGRLRSSLYQNFMK